MDYQSPCLSAIGNNGSLPDEDVQFTTFGVKVVATYKPTFVFYIF